MTPYRTRQSDVEPENRDRSTLAKLDASGRVGGDGAPGAHGSHGAYQGNRGERGGDAGVAEPGQPGGTVTITLARAGLDRVSMSGRLQYPGGGQQHVDEQVTPGAEGDIVIVARGGAGGDGGIGGDGGDGARGVSGSDATRYSSGDDGGPGGTGGDGGAGSDGADGGRGGRVMLVVADDDTDLLMLARPILEPGRGGDPGANGAGGAGGPGGHGGSSYSWSESESYTDSNGQSQTRSTSHTSYGGSTGPEGRSGRSGAAQLSAGRKGAPGELEVRVQGSGGTYRVYPSRYDLRLTQLSHENDNEDGIYEPEERVAVSGIVVRNVGGMPTPNRPLEIRLVGNVWVAPEPQTIVLPRSLGPGEAIELPGTLAFRIGLYVPQGASDPLASDAMIHLDAWLPDVRRGFVAFERDCPEALARFSVRFPVELSTIASLPSLAPGERTRVSFTLTNVSQKPFGMRSEIGRRIDYAMALHASEVPAVDVSYVDGEGQSIALGEGLSGSIERLEPGASVTLSGTLGVSEGATPYAAVRARLTLSLGRIGLPDDPRVVQLRDLVVRVAQRYKPNPSADVLFVVHNRTTRAELDAWNEAARAMNVELALWDVSLEGHFDLTADNAATTLAEQFARKAIVILNGTFDTPLGEQRAQQLLDAQSALTYAAGGGQIVVVGKAPRLSATMHPPTDTPSTLTEGDPSTRALDRAALLTSSSALEVGASAPPFVIRKTYLFGNPTEAELERLARKVAAELDTHWPTRRHIVTYRFDGSVDHNVPFLDEGLLGTLTIRRTLDLGDRSMVSVGASEEALHDPEHVARKAAPLALAWGLGFEARVERLLSLTSATRAPELTSGSHAVELASGEAEAASTEESLALEVVGASRDFTPERALSTALAADLVFEIGSALARPRFAERREGALDGTLPLLSRLARSDLGATPLDPDSKRGAALLELVATVMAVAWSQVRFWELVPPFVWLRRRPRLYFRARGLTRQLLDRAFASNVETSSTPLHGRAKLVLSRIEKAFTRRADVMLRAMRAPRSSGNAIAEELASALEKTRLALPEMPVSEAIDANASDEIIGLRDKQQRKRAKLANAFSRERSQKLVSGD